MKADAVFEYHDVGWVIIMPYYERGSLTSSHLQPGQIKDAIRQILEALRHLHEHGHIHRDIKPGNIMVRNRPSEPLDLVVADYGLISLKNPVTTCGTLGFMAPEIFRNRGLPEEQEKIPYENAVDIYALGILILKLLRVSIEPIDIKTRKLFKMFIQSVVDDELDACDRTNVERRHALEMADLMLKFDPRIRPSAHELLQSPILVQTKAAPAGIQTSTTTTNVSMNEPFSQNPITAPSLDWRNSDPKARAVDGEVSAAEQRRNDNQGQNNMNLFGGRYERRKRNQTQRYNPISAPKRDKVRKNQSGSLLTPRATPKRDLRNVKLPNDSRSPEISPQNPLSKSWDKMELSD